MEAVFRNGRAHTVNMNMLFNLLALGILVLSKVSTCCFVFETQYGNVTDDQEIQVGAGFSYQCHLYNDTIVNYNVTAKDLTLTRNGVPITDQVVVTDDDSIEFVRNVSTVKDSGYYQCYVPIPGYEKPQLVCVSKVSVGTAPKEVSNFTCIGHGLQNLTCSWINPENAIDTKYVLHDYLNDDKTLTRKCPERKSNSCTFRLDSRPAYQRVVKDLNFILEGTNSLGNITQYFSLKHFEIVKPNRPTRVSLKNVTKNSMSMEILAPKGLSYGEYGGGLVYEVKYHSVLPSLGETKTFSVVSEINAVYELSDLVPNTLYKFEVRCHLNNTGGNYYMSDEVIATEITKSDIPYLAPKVDPSGFDWMVIENEIIVNLYWEALPVIYENGNGFHYMVKFHDHYVPHRYRRDTDDYIDVGKNTSYKFQGLSKDSAYMFTIVAANDEGPSFNRSDIVVDKAKKLLHGPKDIQVVKYRSGDHGHFDITWKSPDPQLDTFSVAVCETPRARPDTCDGPISFMQFKDSHNHARLILDYRTNYQFAVASVADGRTSGLHWAPCYVTYGIPYGVKSLQVMLKTSTSLKVFWTYPCPSALRVVKEIEISMCPTEKACSGSESHSESFENCSSKAYGEVVTRTLYNGALTEAVVEGLQPFTHYLAVVRVKTKGGWGQHSNARCESTMPSAPSDVPTHVIAEVDNASDKMPSIHVTFEPPKKPNGIITRHVVLYNNTSIIGGAKEKEERLSPQDKVQPVVILDKVAFYANYSIQVKSCVQQACSNYSKPVHVTTGISVPGIINLPHIEVLPKYVNISWEPPVLANGPLNYYQVLKMTNNSDIEEIYNVSGSETFLVLRESCSSENPDTNTYEIRVRAVNVKDNVSLPGDFSNPLQSMLCAAENKVGLYIGFVMGSIFILVVLVGLIALFNKYVIRSAKNAKHTKIKLPKGFEIENPLSTYDKFKGGLQSNHDSGIPYERGYERFFTSANPSEGKTSELDGLPPITPRSNGRNLSGESDLSSAHTTKTHNSIDSGAEVESPPSPDSYPSDSSGSAHTTPRGYKLALDIVNKAKPRCSNDSGLEDQAPLDLSWLVPPCVYIPRVDKSLVDARSLSNSEPSVADLEMGDEPSIASSVPRSWSCTGLNGFDRFKYCPDPLKSNNNAPGFAADHQVMSVALPQKEGGSPKRDPYSLVGVEETHPYILPPGDTRRGIPLKKEVPRTLEPEVASQKGAEEPLPPLVGASVGRMAGGFMVYEAPQEASPLGMANPEVMENMMASLNMFINKQFGVDAGGVDSKGAAGDRETFPMSTLSPADLSSVPNEEPKVAAAVPDDASDAARDVSTRQA